MTTTNIDKTKQLLESLDVAKSFAFSGLHGSPVHGNPRDCRFPHDRRRCATADDVEQVHLDGDQHEALFRAIVETDPEDIERAIESDDDLQVGIERVKYLGFATEVTFA